MLMQWMKILYWCPQKAEEQDTRYQNICSGFWWSSSITQCTENRARRIQGSRNWRL